MIGKFLRRRRRELEYTQEYVAELAGITRVSMNGIENGKIKPRWETVRKIAEALGIVEIPVQYLDD